jgi:AraC-like DNA-binding protein
VSVEAFLRAPMGACAIAGPILVFCATHELCGAVAWGAPSAGDTRAMLDLFEVYRRPGLLAERFDVVLDGAAIERVDADALAVLAGWIGERRAELFARIRFQASVGPRGLSGYVLAGILPLLSAEHHPFRLFSTATEAFIHVDPARGAELAAALAGLTLDVQGLDPVLGRLRDLLRQRGGAVDVEDAAARLHVSARTLQRLLAASGTSFKEEQLEARLGAASELLRSTDAKIADVAARVGVSERALTLLFRSRRGCTPAEFRRGADDEPARES